MSLLVVICSYVCKYSLIKLSKLLSVLNMCICYCWRKRQKRIVWIMLYWTVDWYLICNMFDNNGLLLQKQRGLYSSNSNAFTGGVWFIVIPSNRDIRRKNDLFVKWANYKENTFWQNATSTIYQHTHRWRKKISNPDSSSFWKNIRMGKYLKKNSSRR